MFELNDTLYLIDTKTMLKVFDIERLPNLKKP